MWCRNCLSLLGRANDMWPNKYWLGLIIVNCQLAVKVDYPNIEVADFSFYIQKRAPEDRENGKDEGAENQSFWLLVHH